MATLYVTRQNVYDALTHILPKHSRWHSHDWLDGRFAEWLTGEFCKLGSASLLV